MAAGREYTDRQREAIVTALSRPKMTARRVCELAQAGELIGADGEALEPFEVPPGTARSFKRRGLLATARERRAYAPPGNTIEALRQRLLALIDRELSAQERQKPGQRDLERLRQVIRAVLEVSKIPALDDQRPPAPAPRDDDGRRNSETVRPGPMLREHRATLPAAVATLPPEPEPALVPEPPEESWQERHGRPFAAGLERALREETDRETHEPEPVGGEDTKAQPQAGSRASRRRRPDEDTESCW